MPLGKKTPENVAPECIEQGNYAKLLKEMKADRQNFQRMLKRARRVVLRLSRYIKEPLPAELQREIHALTRAVADKPETPNDQ